MTGREFLETKLAELRAIYGGFIRLAACVNDTPGSGYWHVAFDQKLMDCRVCDTWDEVLREVRTYAAQRTLDPIYLGM